MADPTEDDSQDCRTSSRMSPLEMEECEDKLRRPTPQPSASSAVKRSLTPRWAVIARYFVLSTVAVTLAAICPGDTVLKKMGINGEASFDLVELGRLVGVYVLLWFAFLSVQASDPGFLTPDSLEDLSLEDGLSLMGYEREGADLYICNSTSSLEAGSPATDSSTKRRTNASGTTVEDEQLEQAASSKSDNGTFRGSRRKRCDVCELAPPLRSHHCKKCQRCVATFDHHCNFLETCIGERNHCRFWLFLMAQAVGFYTCCRVVGSSPWGFITILRAKADDKVMLHALLVVASKFYLYPLTLAAYIMLVVHTLLIVSNSTTFEWTVGPKLDYLRGTELTDVVFSRGCCSNIKTRVELDSGCCCTNPTGRQTSSSSPSQWVPVLWNPPGKIERDSEDWWNHPWQNKYWSCC